MLSTVADLILGYKLAAADARVAGADAWRVLQTRDLDDDGQINWRLVTVVGAGDRKLQACKVQPGDVLFAPRSPRVGAALMGSDVANPPTAASSHFYIIRADPQQLVPEYLAWYLNHPRTREALAARDHGTHLPFIPMDVIRRLDIAVPSLDRQRHIGAVSQLAAHERRLASAVTKLHDEQRAADTWRAAHTD